MRIEIIVDEAKLVEEATQRLVDRLEEKFTDAVDGAVNNNVTKRLNELTDERLREVLDKVLREGWQQTNGYGEPTGKPRTISDMVRAYVMSENNYSSPMNEIFRRALDGWIKGEAGQLLEQATAKLRGMVDTTIAEKLRKAVTEALR